MKIESSQRQGQSVKPSDIVGARPPSAAFGDGKKSKFFSDGKAAEGGRAPGGPESTLASLAKPDRKSRLWLWFVLAFILQLGAWIAWFTIANQHRVDTVPLVTTETPK